MEETVNDVEISHKNPTYVENCELFVVKWCSVTYIFSKVYEYFLTMFHRALNWNCVEGVWLYPLIIKPPCSVLWLSWALQPITGLKGNNGEHSPGTLLMDCCTEEVVGFTELSYLPLRKKSDFKSDSRKAALKNKTGLTLTSLVAGLNAGRGVHTSIIM